MNVYPTTSKYKKRVIKWENVIAIVYTVITLFKYFITSNSNILILLYDLTIDILLGIMLHQIISILRKEEQ